MLSNHKIQNKNAIRVYWNLLSDLDDSDPETKQGNLMSLFILKYFTKCKYTDSAQRRPGSADPGLRCTHMR